MTITKYEHSCLLLTDGNRQLVIDPGVYSLSLPDVSNLDALVITHVHGDHFDPSAVKRLIAANPEATIYTTKQVAAQLNAAHVVVPEIGKTYQSGPFQLQFYGGTHALITESIPQDQNIGVRVNEELYYPGDSLTPCPDPHHVLAVPAMAPWLKLDEALQLVSGDSATTIFPVHDHFLSEDGRALTNRPLTGGAERAHKVFRPLSPGDQL